jgi:hypothetical protein
MDRTTPRDENRIAKIRMDQMEIEHLLGLPPGFHIEKIYPTFDPQGINVIVSGPTLEQQPYDTEAPFLRGVFTRRTARYQGRVWSCWDWDPEVRD